MFAIQSRSQTPRRRWSPFLGVLLCFALAAPATVGAQGLGDQILVSNGRTAWSSALPEVELELDRTFDDFVFGLTYGPEGRLFGMDVDYPSGNQAVAQVIELDDQGDFVALFPVALEESEDPYDLSIGPDGQLYLLTVGVAQWNPIELFTRVYSFDIETGQTTAIYGLNDTARALAPSREGMWIFGSNEGLLHLDILRNRGRITRGPDLGNVGLPVSVDTDSTGALWLATEPGIVDPPIYTLWRFDPATGSARVTQHTLGQTPVSIAIDRRCPFGTTSRCLLGGRFQAEVTWRDFDDRTGAGTLAPTGSTDSALFWFFEPSNWELLVKVIDGCEENGHFWVFAAGTTNVEHTLTVRDLETGEVFTSTNPLGSASSAVTATNAFATCGGSP